MKLVDSLVDFGTLSLLRQKLGLIYGKNLQTQTGLASELDPELLALLRRILLQGKNIVDRWHGSLYFVYLPEWERYAHPERVVKNREVVLQIVKNLGLPLIDLHPMFKAHHDPLSLFPFRGFGHYNEAGHALVAQRVLDSLNEAVHHRNLADLPGRFRFLFRQVENVQFKTLKARNNARRNKEWNSWKD
jgi:hypothetical protein